MIKRTLFKTVATIFFCTFAIAAFAQEKYDISLNIKEGDTFTQELELFMPMQMQVEEESIDYTLKNTITSELKCIAKDGENFRMQLSYKRMIVHVSMSQLGMDYTMDTDGEAPDELNALIGKPLSFLMDKRGKYAGGLDAKAFTDVLEEIAPGSTLGMDGIEPSGIGIVRNALAGISLPDKPISVGESWVDEFDFSNSFRIPGVSNGNISQTQTIKQTLKAVEKDVYIVDGITNIESEVQEGLEMKLVGKVNLATRICRHTGIPIASEGAASLKGEVEAPGVGNMTISADMTMKITIK